MTLDAQDIAELQEARKRLRQSQGRASNPRAYTDPMFGYIKCLLAYQNQLVPPGQHARRYLRVARALQVELDFASGDEAPRAVTMDCGMGGFSALLPLGTAIRSRGRPSARLNLGTGDVVTARVRVADLRKKGSSSARVSFAFVDVSDADLDRLEAFIAEEALRIPWPLAPPSHLVKSRSPVVVPALEPDALDPTSFVLVGAPSPVSVPTAWRQQQWF